MNQSSESYVLQVEAGADRPDCDCRPTATMGRYGPGLITFLESRCRLSVALLEGLGCRTASFCRGDKQCLRHPDTEQTPVFRFDSTILCQRACDIDILFALRSRRRLLFFRTRREREGQTKEGTSAMPATLFPPLSSEDGSALPIHLKSKFDQIKQIRDLQTKNNKDKENATSSAQRANKDEAVEPESTSSASSATETTKGAIDNDMLEQQKIRLAAETAVACESEISRLARAVAELEQLLARREKGEVVSVQSPAFPSIIPNDDDDDDDEVSAMDI